MGGLKYRLRDRIEKEQASHPARDGWIEMAFGNQMRKTALVPSRKGWVD